MRRSNACHRWRATTGCLLWAEPHVQSRPRIAFQHRRRLTTSESDEHDHERWLVSVELPEEVAKARGCRVAATERSSAPRDGGPTSPTGVDGDTLENSGSARSSDSAGRLSPNRRDAPGARVVDVLVFIRSCGKGLDAKVSVHSPIWRLGILEVRESALTPRSFRRTTGPAPVRRVLVCRSACSGHI